MSDKPKLYDYQEEGVRMELAMKRCINGDDMGTGKTIQSIVAIERAKATPCLVICPAALKVNWEREIKRFTNLRPLIHTAIILLRWICMMWLYATTSLLQNTLLWTWVLNH